MTSDADPASEAAFFEMLGRLVPGALHELGSPLAALVAIAELALREAEPGSGLHVRLELLHRTAREVAATVDALQGLSRRRDAPARRFELASEVEEVVGLVLRLTAGHDVEVEVRVEAPARVHAAAADIAQPVVAGLVAALAEAERGDTVEIVVEAAGDAARVSVAGRDVLRLPRLDSP